MLKCIKGMEVRRMEVIIELQIRGTEVIEEMAAGGHHKIGGQMNEGHSNGCHHRN